MFKFTNIVMLAAPIGVFGAVAYTVGHLGLGILLPLLKLLATMYVALAVFITCVLFPIALIAEFNQKIPAAAAEPVTIAFATASSEAALPRAMEEMESSASLAKPSPSCSHRLQLQSRWLQPLPIPGPNLHRASRWHPPHHHAASPDASHLLISSKGTAGVARASLVIVLAAATSFHLPTEPSSSYSPSTN